MITLCRRQQAVRNLAIYARDFQVLHLDGIRVGLCLFLGDLASVDGSILGIKYELVLHRSGVDVDRDSETGDNCCEAGK